MKHWILALGLTTLALGCGDDASPVDAGRDATIDATVDSAMTDSGGGCAAGLTDCDGSCVDLTNDSANCGSCGLVCADSTCVASACDSSCATGTIVCGVRCCDAALGCDPSGSTCAVATPACPTDPPTDGDSCSVGQSCDWLRCATSGHSTATCDGSMWTVTTEACAAFSCAGGSPSGSMCMADQICNQNVGGAFLEECRTNPCGDMPLEKSCACTDCSPENCTISGRTVTCNTCPSGLCP